VDTNSFIYTVELVAPYQALLEPFWQDVRAQGRYALTSELTLMETLVKPLQARDITLETQYRVILVSSPEVRLYPISRAVLERRGCALRRNSRRPMRPMPRPRWRQTVRCLSRMTLPFDGSAA
jgi:hypothetical protein